MTIKTITLNSLGRARAEILLNQFEIKKEKAKIIYNQSIENAKAEYDEKMKELCNNLKNIEVSNVEG